MWGHEDDDKNEESLVGTGGMGSVGSVGGVDAAPGGSLAATPRVPVVSAEERAADAGPSASLAAWGLRSAIAGREDRAAW